MRSFWTACLALLCASPTLAQTGWLPVERSPDGRTSWRAGSDNLLFGFDGDGLVRSRDGGATAERVFEGIETGGYRINDVYVSGGVLAVWAVDDATYRNGLAFFSRDDGDTWTSGVVPDAFVGDFAAVGDTLVFAVDSAERTGGGPGPLRVLWSADGGATWVSEPLDDPSFEDSFSRTLFVNGGALHAATPRGLYRASRGAEGWARVTAGALGEGGGRINLWDSAVGGGAAYASTSGGCGGLLPGVYRLPAGETEWVRSDVEAGLSLQAAACYLGGTLASVGDTVVTGLQLTDGAPTPGVPLSADGGATWQFVGEGLAQRAGGVTLLRAFPAMGTIYVEMYEPDGADAPTGYYRLRTATPVGSEPPPEAPGVRVWPNPTSSGLHVETYAPATVRAYSVTGRLVLPERRVSRFAEVDVSALPPGVYLLDVRRGLERWVERFTVAR